MRNTKNYEYAPGFIKMVYIIIADKLLVPIPSGSVGVHEHAAGRRHYIRTLAFPT